MNNKEKLLNYIKNTILEFANQQKLNSFTGKTICKKMEFNKSDEVKNCLTALNLMVEDGDLVMQGENTYSLASSMGLIKGTIRTHKRGFAFLLIEGGEDVFIPAPFTKGALNNDLVLVELKKEQRGSSKEGRIVKILKRGTKEIVGRFQNNKTFGFVVPDDVNFGTDIFIEGKNMKELKTGTKVVCTIVKYPTVPKESPIGKIVEVLGNEYDPFIDVISIIRAHNIKETFPEEVLLEARSFPESVSQKDIDGRKDFRDQLIITIDGEDARDFDDAIAIEKNADGTFNLGVHIADVAQYVKPNSKLDKEAFTRGTSYYYPDLVIPMLPKELSNGLCSLNEGVDRLVLSVLMQVDRTGKVTKQEICEGVIKSANRMTYTAVAKIIDGDKETREQYSHLVKMCEDMAELQSILHNKRKARGSIDFDVPECKITLDENGRVKDVCQYERHQSNKVIEEFMILANETVAEFMCHLDMPFIYRVHQAPNEEKLENFKHFIRGLGISMKNTKGEMRSKQFLELLESIKETPFFHVVNKVMLRTMSKAKYQPDHDSHFGLASEYYCHFTSPIRRYPDLMIHRIIKLMLHGKINESVASNLFSIVEEASIQSSAREKIADESERDVDDLKKAEFMKDKIGNKYSGVISGVTEFGFFVELDNTVEGLVRTEDFPKDKYVFMPQDYKIVGTKHIFKLGDTVDIVVSKINMETRKIDFILDEDSKNNENNNSKQNSKP